MNIARLARPFIIVLGFVSSMMGTVGSLLFIESINQQVRRLTDAKNNATREIEKLGGLTADYFTANQQGDLIYVLSLQGSARQDVVKLIYQGNLLDRATPIRNVIGALAIAHQLDYAPTYQAYERLNDAARASGEYRDFAAVKALERDVVERAQKRVGELQLAQGPLQLEISALESSLRRRQLWQLLLSSLGAFLLLLANLVEHRAKSTPALGGTMDRGRG